MKPRMSIMMIPIALFLAISSLSAEEAIDLGITNRVQALLDAYAMADDLMDEQLLKKRAELESMGSTAYPALCDILKKSDHPYYQAAIIDVFLRTDGDATEPLKAVRELLKTRRDIKYAPSHRAALKYLGERGGKEDLALLNEYLNADELVTRTIAGKSKARVEKRVADRAKGMGVTNGVPKDTTQ